MKKILIVLIFIMMSIIAGCNNPSGPSSIARNHTPLLEPPAAFSFNQIRANTNQVDIQWQPSARVSTYSFFMGTDPQNVTTPVTNCSGTVESCVITGLDPSTLYYYSIVATNAAGTKVVTTPGRSRAVGDFSIASSSAGQNKIDLTWGSSTTATSYKILYGTSSSSYSSSIANVTSPYSITGLTAGVRYYVRVVAENTDNGYAASLNEINEQPFGQLPAPSGLTIAATPGTITLDWNDSPGVSYYKILRGPSAGALSQIATNVLSSTYTDSVADGTTYFYAVIAYNGVDSSASTSVSAESISAFNISSAVSGPSTNQVTVTWPAVTGGATFDISYGTNPVSLSSTVSNAVSPKTITGLTGGLTYYFRVIAKNAVGTGTTIQSTNQLSAIPIPPIAGPTGLTASASPGSVLLNWTGVSGATNYNIYRGPSAGALSLLFSGTPGTTYTDSTAANGTTYFYSVRAYNGLESSDSNVVSIQPLSSFSLSAATVATFSSVDLTWGSSTGAAAYDVKYGYSPGVYLFTASNKVSPFTLTGLTGSTTYYFAVLARNAVGSGTSFLSNELTATTTSTFPTVTISTFSNVIYSNRLAWSLAGTCSENGRAVTVTFGAVSATPTCTAGAWSTTLNVSAVPDAASRTLTASHTNSGGNSATDTKTISKDATNPTVAITSSPSINNGNKSSYTFSGTCSENTRTVTLSVGGLGTTATCAALAWTKTLDVSSLSDGASVAVTADLDDAAGNTATQATASVLKDTVLPTVAINSPAIINNANKTAYTLSGTCSDSGSNVTVKVGATTGVVTCTLLTWSSTLNVSANADSASLVVTADHTDPAGNAAVQAGTTTLKDTVNPTLTIASAPVINNANKASYTVSGACSENTRTVNVSVGGVTGTPTCTALAWSATLDVSAVADGPSISITASHSDAAGNSANASTTVLKNTALPTVAITSSPVINNTNKAAYTVSGTCSENGRVVSVNAGGVTGSPTCSAGAWTSTLNLTAVSDSATVSITADHVDSVGNSAVQASTTVLKDTVVPTVAVVSSPTINNANKTSYVVSGTCSENGRTVSVLVGAVASSPVCSAGAFSTSPMTVTSVSDGGSVSVTANHTDAAGNNATQASATVVKDTANPTLAITSSPVINATNAGAYTVSGTCSENTRTVSVNVGGVSGSPVCTAGNWSTTLSVSGVSDGTVSVTADHSDAAGNSATQASTSVTKDTVLPTVAITSSPVINNTNKAAYPIAGTCSENSRTVSVNIGGVTSTPTCSTGTWSASLNLSALADSASVAVTVDHTDLSGNAATQATTTLLKDTVIPTVAITSSPAINNTNETSYTVSGTCSENTRTVAVSVGGVTGSPTCLAGAWTTTLNVNALADSGSVSVTANHSDAAGNAATQASATVVKDTTNPTVAITPPSTINNSNKSAWPLSGTCSETGRLVSISVGAISTTANCTLLTWSKSIDVSAETDSGALLVTADHTDASGNSAVQASLSVVKDTVIPTVAITVATTINNSNKASYSVSGTCSENTRTVTVSVGGVTATPNCTAGAWSGTLNVTAVADSASVAVTANHSDAAGNAATQASTTVLKDTSAPTVAITAPSVIHVSNASAYSVSGTCSENTRTVTVSVGGVSGTPTCAAGAWTVSVNASGLSDGTITITADHSDAAGNSATQASTTVTKDTTPPTVAITSSPVINAANKSAYPVSGTCSENGRNVTVNVGGVSSTPACSSNLWSATLNVSAVGDSATVTVTADHSDAAGNAATQASTTVLKDTVIPTVAITSSPAINDANQAAYTVSGSCSENTRSVTVSVGGITATPNCTALAWTATLNVTALLDSGAVTITANHTDAAGNAAVQASTTVIKNTALPTVAITSSPSINNSNKSSYTVSGTCSVNTRPVSVSVGGITSSPTCSALAWSATLNVSALSDGASVSITADHSDSVGNNANQASTTVLKDTVIPTVAITSSPVINSANKASYPISGSCSENTRTVSVSVGGVSGSPVCTAGAWSATLNLSAVSDGASTAASADHTDLAGNNATQATTTILKDTVLPTVAITSSPFINNTNKSAYPISGTCSENTRTVTVSVGGVSATPTCTTGAWSASLNVSALADGSVSVTADHSDLAGNNATGASTSVTKDTALPLVAITSSPAINNTNKAAYPISGTCSENSRTVSVNVGGVTSSPTCSAGVWSGSLNLTAVSDGASIAATADHTDAAGNSATQASTTILKDTIAPTVAITSSPSINNTNKAAYPVSGTCSENTRTVSVSVGGVSGTPTCTGGNWSVSLNVGALADSASVSVTANHSDLAGNAATQASATITKDTTNPTVAITASPAINNTNKGSYTVSGTCSENTRTVSVDVGGVAATPTCTALAWSATLNVTSVSDNASIAVTADHSDLAGNSATQASTSVLKDTVVPTVAISSAPAIYNGNKASYPVSGTCSEDTRTVSVAVGSATATPVCTSGTWSASINVSAVADSASVSVTANHSDLAGNAATQASTTVLKDTVIPLVAISVSPSITNANKTAYTVSGTCSENTRTVSVSVGAVSGTPTCTTGAWTTTLDVSSLSDSASISVTANHTDAAGNSATTASASVIKDTTPPTVAITSSPAINNTNKGAYPVSGTCSENTRTVSVNVGGVASSPSCTTGSWSATLNVTAVADGASVTITADHADAVGNAAPQATTTVLKDTVIPLVAITSSPAINNTNKASYPISGTCSENTRTVTVSVGGVSGTPTCTGGLWSTTLSVTAVSDSASVAVTANHSDLAGNAATQASTTIVKDTSNPTVAISSAPSINNTNKSAYPISGTCTENTRTVSVSVGGVTATPTCSTGAWSASLNVSALSDGASVAVTADHSDAAGNAATQASSTVLKDTVIPTVAITSSPAINNSNKSTYTVSGTCSENTRSVSVSVGGVSGSPTCTTGAWTTTLNVSAVSDGASVAVTANHSDLAGNVATQASTTIAKDTSNPTVAINPPSVINNSNKTSWTVSGTCSETGQSVSISVGGISVSDTCTLLTWTKTLDVSSLIDSVAISVTADHTDAAGNTAVQAALTVVKDTVPPTVALTSTPVINNANKSSYVVSGTCSENGRVVSVNVGGVAASPSCTAGAFTTAGMNISAVADSASLSVTANHTDAAGNTATQASTTVVKDTSNPLVAITSSPIINLANRAAYPVSGTCSENSQTVTVSVGGLSTTPTCSGGAWSTSLNVTALTDGASISITANHTDASGNAATQASTTVLKDTVAPTVALTTTEGTPTSATSWIVRATFSESVTGVAIGDFTVGNATSSLFNAVSAVAFEITVAPSVDGAVTINMAAGVATDAAGNSNTAASQLSRTYQSPALLSFAVTTTYDFGSVNVGSSADVTVVVNKSGTANATAITETSLAAPFAFKGGSFPGTGGTCTTTISGSCSLVFTFTPTSGIVSSDAIVLQYNNGAGTTSITRNLTGTGVVTTPVAITITGPAGILINQCIPYTVTSVSATGTASNVSSAQAVTLVTNNSNSGTGTFYSNNTCSATITSTSIASGTSSTTVYYKHTAAGQNLTLVFNPATLTASSINVNTSSAPTKISFTPPSEMQKGTCNPILVKLVDASGYAVGKSTTVQVNLAENGNAVFYSDDNCTGAITNTVFAAYQEQKTIYVSDPSAEAITLTFTDNAGSLSSAARSVTFVNFLTWWNNSWLKRLPIILDNSDQATTFTTLQVLVRLSPSVISYADTKASGADIRFTLSDHATALKYEIESWSTSGESLVWVTIPSMAASSNMIIYMYYNNTSATDGQDAANTWSGFSGIWNMKKSGANYVDSTGSGKTGVPGGGTVTDVTGPVGNAITVGAGSHIDTGFNLATIMGVTSTFSLWMKTANNGSSNSYSSPGITGIEQSGGGNDIFYGWINNLGRIGITAGNGATATSNFTVTDNNWRHVTMSRNSATGAIKFYVNGVLNGSGTSETGAKTLSFTKFGLMLNTGGGTLNFSGSMDGIRLKNFIETDARIRAEYKFMTTTNISYGSPELY